MAYCLELKRIIKRSLQYLALVSDDYAPAKHLEAIVKALDGGGGTGEAAGAGRELKKHLLELEKTEAPKDQKERCRSMSDQGIQPSGNQRRGRKYPEARRRMA